ncbi:Myristoyl-CoA:protein N-myristoyltransferase, C-terminal [Phytophthora cactorum]|nr:Myristoyl-CoA:protein N-myristoyltransferase, C-terminal [Phytophthora cactorum]
MNQDEEQEDFLRVLKQLNVVQQAQQLEKEHRFWGTQPVPTLQDQNGENSPDCLHGPIDVPQKTPDQANEVYELLSRNYVEDTDSTFRFDYSVDFLQWALTPPDYHKDWHIGVRSTHNNQLMAFISGIPVQVRVYNKTVTMAEINFLCVTRDCEIDVVLPMPVAQCRYFHRSLNPKKLIEVGFSPLPPRMTLAQTIKALKLPTHTSTPGFRAMERTDVPEVTRLLKEYLTKFHLAAEFREEEVAHWMVPRVGVVNAYVVENPDTQDLTDKLNAVYSFYNVAKSVTLTQLMQDALIMAQKEKADVFNALNVMENVNMLQPLKFGPGSGELQYYLYNWRCPRMSSDRVGIVLC